MNVLEHTHVESPLLDQLSTMGWKLNIGNHDDPGVSARTSFREVFLEQELRACLRRINPGPDGKPWLDEQRLAQAVSALTRFHASSLLEANQALTRLLVDGIDVEGLPGWDGGRSQRVRYIDFDHPSENTFRAISQFRVEQLGAQAKAIVPDIVLFVNGIPVVVIECKSPKLSAPLEEGIEQLQRYSNQVEGIVGNEALFRTNAFLVVTTGDEARAGTVGARAVHFAAWKDTSPTPKAEVAAALGLKTLNAQHVLVAGMLRPAHLLDIMRSFTVFLTDGGRTYKAIARYQQFRAVHLAMARLRTGKTRAQDRDHRDRRGGVIWHTQGSGKSLTMVFLVRRMRCDPELRRFKVVFVTDRKDLQTQLAASAELAGEPIRQARKVKELRSVLAPKGPGIVFAMIQKYRDLDDEGPAPASADDTADPADLDVINDDPNILVLVDEAHRSHTDTLHANLDAALPNAARIGFTGTPIIMGEKKRTRDIFGDLIDKYTLRESEADGATVPIVYEGRTADAAVADGRNLDELFEDMLRDRTPEELEAIKRKYATRGDVVAAPKLIAAKAVDILEHYVENVLPNGFKAQLVAVTRRATLLYYDKLLEARAAMLHDIDQLDPSIADLDEDQAGELPRRQRILHRARKYRELIAELEFAPVISGGGGDPDAYAEWTDRDKIDARIAQFKRPLVHADPAKRSPLAFLIVKSMLLTGFDAPGEQVLYLDRAMREAELLQAIARVNRTHGEKKRVGLVVDYYGVARHLAEALAAYEQDDIEGSLHSIKDELPKLRDQHERLVAMFRDRGIVVSGMLSHREREALAEQFRGWKHPAIGAPSRAAMLGDGSFKAAMRAVLALERFLLAPLAGTKDDFSQLHPRFVQAVRRLLDRRTPALERDTFARDLVMLVEPMCFKILGVFEPSALADIGKKKRGLATALLTLAERGRSRYTLKLTPQEFEQEAGWSDRTSYERAIRDVVPARLDAAHRAAEVAPDTWRSTMTVMLGLADANLEDFERHGAAYADDINSDIEALETLRDDKLRATMHVELKNFLSTLDTVLPRAEARPYLEDAKHFTALHERARRLYRGGERPIGREVGEKVRALIDEHVVSLGIDPKIPPVEILDAKFDAHVGRVPSARAKASEMEHALRHHIRMHEGEDPVHYQSLSERLEEILEQHEGQWDEIVEQLGPLFAAVRGGRQADDSGLEPQSEAPFYHLMRKHVAIPWDDAVGEKLKALTVELVGHTRSELSLVGFWKKPAAVAQLRASMFTTMDDTKLFDYDALEKLADDLLELARNNHARLTS